MKESFLLEVIIQFRNCLQAKSWMTVHESKDKNSKPLRSKPYKIHKPLILSLRMADMEWKEGSLASWSHQFCQATRQIV